MPSDHTTHIDPRAAARTRPMKKGSARVPLVGWLDRWAKTIRRCAGRHEVSRPTAVDDLTHEIFRTLRRYGDDARIQNRDRELFCVSHTVVNDWYARVGARTSSVEVDPARAPIEAAQATEDPILRARNVERLQTAVDQLPARQRESLRLHIHEGLTYQQIAQRRGLACRLVRRDLARAYSALRQYMLGGEA